jgi:hypothetical protein
MKLLEENGKMYGYEITQKVKLLLRVNSILPKALCIPPQTEAEGILDVEIEKLTTACKVLQTNRSRRKGNSKPTLRT